MSRNSPSARYHRAIVFLAHLEQYRRLGPLVGPKEEHQPDPRWEPWYRAASDPDWSPGALTTGQPAWFTGGGPDESGREGEDPMTTIVTRDEARIEFLDLMIPQLEAGGFRRLAAEYGVERDRLRQLPTQCVACGVAVTAVAVAVRAADILCMVTPDSVHTLNPESVEIGATTSTLGSVDRPGHRWLFFTTCEARDAYVATYGHRYDYLLDWDDVSGFALEAVTTYVRGGQGYQVPDLATYGAVDTYWDS